MSACREIAVSDASMTQFTLIIRYFVYVRVRVPGLFLFSALCYVFTLVFQLLRELKHPNVIRIPMLSDWLKSSSPTSTAKYGFWWTSQNTIYGWVIVLLMSHTLGIMLYGHSLLYLVLTEIFLYLTRELCV